MRKFLDQTTFLGFTATANYTIVSDIQKQLGIKQEKIFSPIPFEKANISYNFIELATPKDMMQKAKEIVDELIRRNQRTIIFTKNENLWHYCLFASKNILMFAYGFAVPIDWETHQLLSKTE